MAASRGIVHVIDDDELVRDSVAMLLKAEGITCETYESADEFLSDKQPKVAGCLVCDMRMPGTTGLELQSILNARGSLLPIVFVTGHADVSMAVEAMRNGASSFIEKPFTDEQLLSDVNRALGRHEKILAERQLRDAIGQRIDRLTDREREVMDLVVAGKANKVVAFDLDVSQRTVEIHRARVMEKMEARSLAELVRMHIEYFGK